MAPSTPDDGFHEIQLNGKQLVFLFMAATVVSVVIFLCGVLVGRGVRAERGGTAENAAATDVPTADITPSQAPVPAAQAQASPDSTVAAPPPPAEDLSYFKRLEDPKQPAEDLKKAAAAAAAAPAPAASAKNTPSPKQSAKNNANASASSANPPASAPASKTTAPADTSASADLQPPAGQGYAVQIAALNVRSEADAIAKHLASKGYAAYVSSNGSPAIYRVRIGTFKTKREAETVAAKLQREEQMKPWVTR